MDRRKFTLGLAGALTGLGLPADLRLRPRVNGERLNAQLETLAEFGKNSLGGVSRVAYSEADLQARSYVTELMRRAGLKVSIDVAGNLVGRRSGRNTALPPLVMGSHIDTVPEGGKYDGTVGSLGAVEVAQTLADFEIELWHPLEVIIFQNEEHGSNGSRALSDTFTDADLDIPGHGGITRRDGIRLLGGDPDLLASARRRPGDVAAYLELHIEQGGILEQQGIDIGVVEGIVGNNRWEVTVQGVANHAGATPMHERRDALLAAARFIDSVNRIVTSVPGRQVATVGKLEAKPGAPNVIVGEVILTLEMRDLDRPKVDRLFQRIQDEARNSIGPQTGTEFRFQRFHDKKPVLTNESIQRQIKESAEDLGLSTLLMPSSAGHDSQNIAPLAPIGMIFIPSIGGVSHSAAEYSRPQDITAGANVLLGSLLRLDTGLAGTRDFLRAT